MAAARPSPARWKKPGLKANFIQGQRVTDEATVKIVDEVLSREINPEVVATINSLGGQAVGFAGTDIFTCRKLWLDDGPAGEKIDIGFVGEVTGVNIAPLAAMHLERLHAGHQPDRARRRWTNLQLQRRCRRRAGAIALKAKRLVFMSDVPGLMRDPKDESTFISHLQHRRSGRIETAPASLTRA